MGNACVKPSKFAVEAENSIKQQQSPASATKQEAVRESSTAAGGDVQAAALSPRPPSGSKANAAPRPGQKKCCFAEGPATEWQIPAAEAGPAESTAPAQPQQP